MAEAPKVIEKRSLNGILYCKFSEGEIILSAAEVSVPVTLLEALALTEAEPLN